MAEATPKAAAAYLPFRTFQSVIDSLEHGVPKKLDRSMWRQASVVQGQIMSALRFFSLIDDNDAPTPALIRLADPVNREKRPEQIGALLRHAYRTVLDEHNLDQMTPRMLEEMMEQYGVTGDTRRKAVAFFLRAAKFAGLSMHPLLLAQIRNSSPKKKRRRSAEGDANGSAEGSQVTPKQQSIYGDPKTKSVTLPSGTVVTLTIDANWLEMSAEERTYVFGLVDSLQKVPTVSARVRVAFVEDVKNPA
jgi:hypothetical protein